MSETDVAVDTRITDDRTVIDVTGSRDVAVVVRSADGERVYLPPQGFDEPVSESPYTSPYRGSAWAATRARTAAVARPPAA